MYGAIPKPPGFVPEMTRRQDFDDAPDVKTPHDP